MGWVYNVMKLVRLLEELGSRGANKDYADRGLDRIEEVMVVSKVGSSREIIGRRNVGLLWTAFGVLSQSCDVVPFSIHHVMRTA